MKNTGAEKGDLHHRFQSLKNVFVGGLVATLLRRWRPRQHWCSAPGRDYVPAVADACFGSAVPRSSPGSSLLDYVESIACSGGRQEVDRVDDRHGDDVFLRAKIESANPVYDLLCEYRCLHIGRLQLAK